MKWISVKDGLPTDKDDKNFFVFAKWRPGWNTFLSAEMMTWEEFKDWRPFAVKSVYTHYLRVPKISIK